MCGGKGVCLGVGWGVHGVICSTVLAYMGPVTGGSCCKYHFCGDKSFVVANDEHMFVVTKHVFCHDRRCVLSQQTHVCYDKHEFVTTKVLLRQRWYLWQLPPMIEDQVSMWRLLHEVLMYGGKGVCVWGGGGGGGEGRGAWGDLSNSAGIYMGTRFDVLMCVGGGGGCLLQHRKNLSDTWPTVLSYIVYHAWELSVKIQISAPLKLTSCEEKRCMLACGVNSFVLVSVVVWFGIFLIWHDFNIFPTQRLREATGSATNVSTLRATFKATVAMTKTPLTMRDACSSKSRAWLQSVHSLSPLPLESVL